MAKTKPFRQVRIDQDLYDFFVEYAKQLEDEEGYISATQLINRLLRQSVRAVGIAEAADPKYNKNAPK